MSELTDVELIARVQRGEPAALEALYDRYAPWMLGLAARLVGQREAAEDILQEAFFQVWQRAETFNPARGAFPAWLITIVRSRSIDHLRRRSTRPADDAFTHEAWADLPDPNFDVLTIVSQQERRLWIQGALACLPEDQRQVVELSFFGGLTRREIAARLCLPEGTIHTRARLALQKLRSLLEPGFLIEVN
ncbi:MAG: sigma-70 family RNA polymerase sigma factor [Chloroflexi bacterium]|nr:sigma-70 family RNA polymerase sigma factor [Chloroflexota bacterium]